MNQDGDQDIDEALSLNGLTKIVIGLSQVGQPNSVVLQLFSSAVERVMQSVEWAKAHPEAARVEVILYGEGPATLMMSMERTAFLSLVADLSRQSQGITLQ